MINSLAKIISFLNVFLFLGTGRFPQLLFRFSNHDMVLFLFLSMNDFNDNSLVCIQVPITTGVGAKEGVKAIQLYLHLREIFYIVSLYVYLS